MRFLNLAIAPALAALTSAEIIKVEVGEKNGIKFTPDNIKAAKGDIVEFHFDSMHSVVAGAFDKPCNPVSSGGFYSDELPKGDKTYFSITINSTDPIFYYCGIEGHCQGGMVGVINQSGDETLAKYKSASAKADKVVTPKNDEAFGGTVGSKAVSSGAASGTASTASKSASSAPKTTATTGSESASQAATTTSAASGTGTAASGSPSSSPTTTSSDGGHNMPLEGLVCLVLAGIAAIMVL